MRKKLRSRFGADGRGTISIIAAAGITGLIGVSAIALDFAHVYLIQSESQRIADVSAVTAAIVYAQAQAAGDSATAAQAAASSAAQSFALSNGAGSDTVTAAYVAASPSGDGNSAEEVTVGASVALTPFAHAVFSRTTLNTTESAWAEITGVPACIIALDSPGVGASNGSTSSGITATNCAIASDGSVTVASGPSVTAQAVYAVGSISPTGTTCNGSGCVTSSPTAGRIYPSWSAPSDPFAAEMATPFAHLTSAATYPSGTVPSHPAAPSGTATANTACGSTITAASWAQMSVGSWSGSCAITFAGSTSTPTQISGSGITVNGTATLNLGAGSYYIEGITVSGGSTLTVNVTPPATIDIWKGIQNSNNATFNGSATYQIFSGGIVGGSGSTVFTNTSTSQPSTFNIAGGIQISSGGTGTFPDGSYTVISPDSNGWGIDGNNGNAHLTFGNGSYNIAGGIYLSGSGSLTLGNAGASDPTTNTSFVIPSYTSSNNYALSTGGGSTLTFGSFAEYDINGPVNLSGNATLGSGIYYINSGTAAIGLCGGCNSGGTSITGSNVSIVTTGTMSFANGYSSINLTAPSSGGTSGVTLASSYTSSSTANSFSGGTSGTDIAGAIYTPNSPLSLSNDGQVSGGGNCLMVVAYSITLNNGTSISTNCANMPSAGGGGSVALVQ